MTIYREADKVQTLPRHLRGFDLIGAKSGATAGETARFDALVRVVKEWHQWRTPRTVRRDSRRDGNTHMTDADDYLAACDDLADLGLTEDQIDNVWRWHRITARRQAQTAGGVAIVRLLTYMLTGHKDADLHLRLIGLAFGVGMGHLSGHEHQAAAAHALGVSRQAVADAGERARKAILG